MSEIETVEVTEPVVEQKPAEEAVAPTREELRGKGWTKEELDAAEKRGMVAAGEVKDAPKAEEPKPEETKKAPEPAKEPEKKPSGIPEFTFKTPEQEKAWLEAFGPGTPQRGLYFRMKNERQARQAIEAERDALRREIEALKGSKPAEKGDDDLESLLSDTPAEGQGKAQGDDKPLTLKDLKEMRAAEQKEQERHVKLSEAHREHEAYARSVYPDFDDAVNQAKDVMQKLEEFVPEKWKQAKVVRLMQDLQVAAAKADQLGLDDLNAAHIAYEIAQYHPEHGKAKKADTPAKVNGGLTPEAMKRIEQNTQRRPSSASVSASGGTRTVSVDDIGVKELAAMSSGERWKFREKYPDRYDRIVRG